MGQRGDTVLGPLKVAATGIVRTNFAGPHLFGAAMFARQAFGLEQTGIASDRPSSFFDETRSFVVAAILLSVACAEAWAGEVAADPDVFFPLKDLATTRAALDEMIRWSSVARKYNRLAELANVAPPDFAAGPDAAMKDLILLRNNLIHFHAEWPDARDVHEKVERCLVGRFRRSPLLHPGGAFFPDAFASYDAARWSVTTARGFVERVAERAGWPHPWAKPIHADKLVLPDARS
ncbi:MAG: hypothetical protein QOK37_1724 [Thermoanaerobaculia bacterium]|jgi:hypothetical protein|nr:hypothetical protein [Thermoanaerobaculia bacterium]